MPGFACNVVILVVVADGYPEAYSEGDLINLGPVPPSQYVSGLQFLLAYPISDLITP